MVIISAQQNIDETSKQLLQVELTKNKSLHFFIVLVWSGTEFLNIYNHYRCYMFLANEKYTSKIY